MKSHNKSSIYFLSFLFLFIFTHLNVSIGASCDAERVAFERSMNTLRNVYEDYWLKFLDGSGPEDIIGGPYESFLKCLQSSSDQISTREFAKNNLRALIVDRENLRFYEQVKNQIEEETRKINESFDYQYERTSRFRDEIHISVNNQINHIISTSPDQELLDVKTMESDLLRSTLNELAETIVLEAFGFMANYGGDITSIEEWRENFNTENLKQAFKSFTFLYSHLYSKTLDRIISNASDDILQELGRVSDLITRTKNDLEQIEERLRTFNLETGRVRGVREIYDLTQQSYAEHRARQQELKANLLTLEQFSHLESLNYSPQVLEELINNHFSSMKEVAERRRESLMESESSQREKVPFFFLFQDLAWYQNSIESELRTNLGINLESGLGNSVVRVLFNTALSRTLSSIYVDRSEDNRSIFTFLSPETSQRNYDLLREHNSLFNLFILIHIMQILISHDADNFNLKTLNQAIDSILQSFISFRDQLLKSGEDKRKEIEFYKRTTLAHNVLRQMVLSALLSGALK